MSNIQSLLDQNKAWAARKIKDDPTFFDDLAHQQTPEYLWIGCSDSRVPSTQLVDLHPGDMFVHRNIANVVVHTDFNCLSVLQYAVEVLKVKHVIVCGHYGCGGVKAALKNLSFGLIDNWLRHVQDVYHAHEASLKKLEAEAAQLDLLCELNVLEQVLNVGRTTILQSAWAKGQELAVHGLIYGVGDGLLRDLGLTVRNQADLVAAYESAVTNASA
jgi:carbonic anhydrase